MGFKYIRDTQWASKQLAKMPHPSSTKSIQITHQRGMKRPWQYLIANNLKAEISKAKKEVQKYEESTKEVKGFLPVSFY